MDTRVPVFHAMMYMGAGSKAAREMAYPYTREEGQGKIMCSYIGPHPKRRVFSIHVG